MLTIQKVVKLLDDFHFDVFREYVKGMSIRSYYPLALIDVISREVDVAQDSDFLCKAIYDEKDEKTKKKFFQMAHYTFNLSSFLSKNYPSYLQNNLTRAQHLINTNKLDKANALLEILLEISKKVEDFSTEMQACEIMVQLSLLAELPKQALAYQRRIAILLKNQQNLNDIYLRLYEFYDAKEKPTVDTLVEHQKFYASFFDDNSILIKVMSRYYYAYVLHYSRSSDFYNEDTFRLLEEAESLIQKNETITFPYLSDPYYRVGYHKLKYWNDKGELEKVGNYVRELIQSSSEFLYWNTLVNPSEIAIMAIRTNLFAREHLRLLDCDVLGKSLTAKAEKELILIRNKLEQLLKNPKLPEGHPVKYINLCTYHALISLCGTREQIKGAIKLLDKVLFTYQQLSFHSYIAPIYSILGTAYFKIGDHEGVSTNFRRYKKQTKNQAVHAINDLTIHAIYYTSMWMSTGKRLYAKKFQSIYSITQKNPLLVDLSNLLLDMSTVYKIPV